MTKWLIGILALVVAYMAVSPLITIYQMRSAAEARDGETLSGYVDFPAVRQDLKDQLNARIGMETTREIEKNPLAALGGMLVGAVVDVAVDAFVTPAGLIQLMKGEVPEIRPGKRKRPEGEASREKPFGSATFAYEAWDRFVVSVPKRGGGEVRFVLGRRGLGWVLKGIKIPL